MEKERLLAFERIESDWVVDGGRCLNHLPAVAKIVEWDLFLYLDGLMEANNRAASLHSWPVARAHNRCRSRALADRECQHSHHSWLAWEATSSTPFRREAGCA